VRGPNLVTAEPRGRRLTGESISVAAARRIALAAQGFADSRPSGRVDARHLRRVIDRVGVLQLDSVNVLCRSHYLPVFARLGSYSRASLDRMSWGDDGRKLFEYFWGHKAALLPLRTYPLLRWRMRAAERQAWDGPLDPDLEVPWAVVVGMRRLSRERPRLVDDVLTMVAEQGPIAAGDAGRDGSRRSATDPHPDPSTGRMWNWQDAKIALEYLFSIGRVTIARRRNFERLYDLSERVLPADVLTAPEPSADQAQRELIRISARSLGIATARELCGATGGHFPLPAATAKSRIAELVEAGELIPVRAEGVSQQSYLWSEAREPRELHARALLSPFDALIWNRDRTQRLFDFHYRISIYTPVAKRTHGYYVLPFLLGDQLVARVDLKADRGRSALLVPTGNAQPDVRLDEVAGKLAAELDLMAGWLGLDRVVVGARGNLAAALSTAVGRSSLGS
jgi:uncharacterized protein